MPLELLRLKTPIVQLPQVAVDLLDREARAQLELRQRGWDQPPAGFIASDYPLAFATLTALLERGVRFCEWGSGTGVVTILADWLGFESSGIEVQPALVDLARELADEAGSSATFVCGSFVPEQDRTTAGMFADNDGEDGHQLLGIEPHEIDIVYCYPWPEDEQATAVLFERWARVGALLVTCHGDFSLSVRMKVA